jgi:glycosyltransferase involved in cell wall biosynthesis
MDSRGRILKIALVVPGGVDRSGEYRVIPALLALIRRLAALHELHVFALRQETAPARWMLHGAHIHNVGMGWTRVRALRAIRAEHLISPFDVVQSIWSAACGLVAVAAARAFGVPSLVHVAGGEPARLPEIGFGGRLTRRGRLQEAFVLRGATAVTAASAPLVRLLAQLGCDAACLPLGVDLAEWPPCAPVPRGVGGSCGLGPARLVHVASLNRVKDQSTLLRAMALLANWEVGFELDVIGEDTLHGEIQSLAQRLGLAPRVRFHGFLPQRQLLPLIRAAHVMVMSSRHEAGPFAMLEAAVQGIPTVGTAVGHIAEWAPAAAVAVRVGDPDELARAVRQLLESEERRLLVAREAHQRAVLDDADRTAARFQALYATLTEGAAR